MNPGDVVKVGVQASIVVRGPGGEQRFALIDRGDAAWTRVFKWYLSPKGYAVRFEKRGGQQRSIYMHREIMGLSPGDPRQVDHISRDRLDNRRVNLRLVSAAEQGQNVGAHRDSTSAYRGVSWDLRRSKWAAQATLAGRTTWLGLYDVEEAAAAAASAWRAKHMPFAVEGKAAR